MGGRGAKSGRPWLWGRFRSSLAGLRGSETGFGVAHFAEGRHRASVWATLAPSDGEIACGFRRFFAVCKRGRVQSRLWDYSETPFAANGLGKTTPKPVLLPAAPSGLLRNPLSCPGCARPAPSPYSQPARPRRLPSGSSVQTSVTARFSPSFIDLLNGLASIPRRPPRAPFQLPSCLRNPTAWERGGQGRPICAARRRLRSAPNHCTAPSDFGNTHAVISRAARIRAIQALPTALRE